MRRSLTIREQAVGEGVIWPALMDAGLRSLLIILPILGATFIAALAAPLAIGGWNFSGASVDAEILEAESGRGPRPNVLGARPVELGKGIAKVFVVSMIAWVLLKGMTPQMWGCRASRCRARSATRRRSPDTPCWCLCFGLVAIAAFDVPFQLWQHSRDLR